MCFNFPKQFLMITFGDLHVQQQNLSVNEGNLDNII